MTTVSTWVQDPSEEKIVLIREDAGDVQVDDLVLFEIFGQSKNLYGQGTIEKVKPDSVSIKVTGQLKARAATENARARVTELTAQLCAEISKSPVQVTDISTGGCCLECPLEFELEKSFPITLRTCLGEVFGKFTVKNCAPKDFTGSIYRTGGTLEVTDRIAVARWTNLLAEYIQA